ncbi:MAG: ZIP family metal transporter [Deltaproteobacteria bacterium]|nr:ZIP family metal transporter [Deltaproteobacteria bacterium]
MQIIFLVDYLTGVHPILQALLGAAFAALVTALGAALIFTHKEFKQSLLDVMLGFAAGIMMAASFWSLLAPSIEMSEEMGYIKWVPPLIGFLAGGVFLRLIDKLVPHLHLGFPIETAEGIKTSWRRSVLLTLAITLHNIPEGLAIGVAFGSVSAGLPSATLAGAIALAIGIGIQDFPEGLAIAMPLRREGLSRLKSFMIGALSGVVEPIAAVIGAGAVIISRPILPYALAFAAGAMIFVVVEEVIPESQTGGNRDLATLGAMVGFAVMMVLDTAFG